MKVYLYKDQEGRIQFSTVPLDEKELTSLGYTFLPMTITAPNGITSGVTA